MAEANDGTGAGLLAFLDWAGTRGELNPATGKSMAVSAGKVLAVEPDPSLVDLRSINLDDLFGRFEMLNRMEYTTHSMQTYRSRFFRAVSMYLAWLDKRPDWKSASLRPVGAEVAIRSGNGTAKTSTAKTRPRRTNLTPRAVAKQATGYETEQSVASSTAMIPYDLPLRPGLRVRLVLPEVLTQADAKRIAAFVTSLAFDQAEVPEGASA